MATNDDADQCGIDAPMSGIDDHSNHPTIHDDEGVKLPQFNDQNALTTDEGQQQDIDVPVSGIDNQINVTADDAFKQDTDAHMSKADDQIAQKLEAQDASRQDSDMYLSQANDQEDQKASTNDDDSKQDVDTGMSEAGDQKDQDAAMSDYTDEYVSNQESMHDMEIYMSLADQQHDLNGHSDFDYQVAKTSSRGHKRSVSIRKRPRRSTASTLEVILEEPSDIDELANDQTSSKPSALRMALERADEDKGIPEIKQIGLREALDIASDDEFSPKSKPTLPHWIPGLPGSPTDDEADDEGSPEAGPSAPRRTLDSPSYVKEYMDITPRRLRAALAYGLRDEDFARIDPDVLAKVFMEPGPDLETSDAKARAGHEYTDYASSTEDSPILKPDELTAALQRAIANDRPRVLEDYPDSPLLRGSPADSDDDLYDPPILGLSPIQDPEEDPSLTDPDAHFAAPFAVPGDPIPCFTDSLHYSEALESTDDERGVELNTEAATRAQNSPVPQLGPSNSLVDSPSYSPHYSDGEAEMDLESDEDCHIEEGPATMSQYLTLPKGKSIMIPQVICGNWRVTTPNLDPMLASQQLKHLLSLAASPQQNAWLWRAFLGANTVTVPYPNGPDIILAWLGGTKDAGQKRWGHIKNLEFSDFFSHDSCRPRPVMVDYIRAIREKEGLPCPPLEREEDLKWSVYQPVTVAALCRGLETLKLTVLAKQMPGYYTLQKWEQRRYHRRAGFDEEQFTRLMARKYRLVELFEKTGPKLSRVNVKLQYTSEWLDYVFPIRLVPAKSMERDLDRRESEMQRWRESILDAFRGAAEAAGRGIGEKPTEGKRDEKERTPHQPAVDKEDTNKEGTNEPAVEKEHADKPAVKTEDTNKPAVNKGKQPATEATDSPAPASESSATATPTPGRKPKDAKETQGQAVKSDLKITVEFEQVDGGTHGDPAKYIPAADDGVGKYPERGG